MVDNKGVISTHQERTILLLHIFCNADKQRPSQEQAIRYFFTPWMQYENT